MVGDTGDSLIEVWMDDVLVVTRTDTLGVDPITMIEIGDRGGGDPFDVIFDDVLATAP